MFSYVIVLPLIIVKPPVLKSQFSFHLGCSYAQNKRQEQVTKEVFCSFIPRPSHQYAKTEGEGLVHFIM